MDRWIFVMIAGDMTWPSVVELTERVTGLEAFDFCKSFFTLNTCRLLLHVGSDQHVAAVMDRLEAPFRFERRNVRCVRLFLHEMPLATMTHYLSRFDGYDNDVVEGMLDFNVPDVDCTDEDSIDST